MAITRHLANFRARLRSQGLSAFIVGSEDAHQSEYVADHDLRRAFISNFTGSAGTALITLEKALLWTDGRYFLQASKQLSNEWDLMRSGEQGVPSLTEWLIHNLKAGDQVGVDPWLVSADYAKSLSSDLSPIGATLVPVHDNPVDAVWEDQPPRQFNPVKTHPLSFAGTDVHTKLAQVRDIMRSKQMTVLVLVALDEIAWLFNLRGSDISYNPVFLAYAVVHLDRCHIFNDYLASQESQGNTVLGNSISCHAYANITQHLSVISPLDKVWMVNDAPWIFSFSNSSSCNDNSSSNCCSLPSPIQLLKSVKNQAEIAGMTMAHLRDGVALTAFLAWIDNKWPFSSSSSSSSYNQYTEWNLCEILEDYRSKQPMFAGLSFPTICGYGPNGAIIHYHPTADHSSLIVDGGNLLLIDSGAQYLDGTTDVTRTIYLPLADELPSQIFKECFTRVLKGVIAIGQAKFPIHTLGSRLDVLARSALWEVGLDYKHGTGHGVGAYLNVHEGPQGIGYRKRVGEVGFQPGMTVSDEPGYYEDGKFGIRIENVCVCKLAETQFSFGSSYCEFDTITLAPIQHSLIDATLLNESELRWINDYHAKVRRELGPLMAVQYPEAMSYLMRETEPIYN